jgi:hypothetical protein
VKQAQVGTTTRSAQSAIWAGYLTRSQERSAEAGGV